MSTLPGIGDPLEQALADEEGYRPKPYRDTKGLWTLGEGLCLERSPITAELWRALLNADEIEVKISRAGARRLLRWRVAVIEDNLRLLLPWFGTLDRPRQIVLIQMAYQMGASFVAKFPKFIDAVRRGNYEEAREHGLNSIWAREDSPARAQRLMRKLVKGEY